MTTTPPSKTTHIDRTATSSRDPTLHAVTLSHIDEVNPQIRLLRFDINDTAHGMKFRPGQWLDTYTPTPKPGGLTIISPPASALPLPSSTSQSTSSPNDRLQTTPYTELAIQRTTNPPAQYLWQPPSQILHTQLDVRVGGDFTYPPPHYREHNARVQNLVLVAGGVGVNPFMSILSHISHTQTWPTHTALLYGTKVPETGLNSVLFYNRLNALRDHMDMTIFAGSHARNGLDGVVTRRMMLEDVKAAVCDEAKVRDGTLVFVCGPQAMTDEFVEGIRGIEGMRGEDVLVERWW